MNKEIQLETPVKTEDARALRTGDSVLLNGIIYTGRDAFHRYAAEDAEKLPFSLEGGCVYHCGPIIKGAPGDWSVRAAGPTTSARMEPYIRRMIERYFVRIFIGKGGLGAESLKAFREFGTVYLSAAGGCASLLAETIEAVEGVFFLEEFGFPEAVWKLRVKNMPLLVTMDSEGGNIHREIMSASSAKFAEMVQRNK